MTSMKAVRIHGYGDSSVLVFEDTEIPTPSDGQVLIRSHASSVNPFDCAARAGYMSGWYPYNFPHTLGLDVSGIVESVGNGVTEFKPGDMVWARSDPASNGGYAEYVCVDASDVSAKPRSLDLLHAAALPHVGLTAWRALVDVAQLSSGQSVLIHAAAGGVGTFAVQLAKSYGAKVIGTSSGKNLELLRELGADEVIDYTQVPFEKVAKDVDVVLDAVGADTQERSWSVIRPGGVLLSLVQAPSEEAAAKHGVRQQLVAAFPPAGQVLRQISALVDAGKIKPVIAGIHPLSETPMVHDLVSARHSRGKHILKIS